MNRRCMRAQLEMSCAEWVTLNKYIILLLLRSESVSTEDYSQRFVDSVYDTDN